LAGKVALVTGGSRGMGLALCRTLAGAGAAVYMVSRGEAELVEMAATIRGAMPLVCDVGDGAQVERCFARIRQDHGGLDILINNAGLSRPAPIEEVRDDHLGQEIAVNLLGPIYTMRAAVPLMRERGGGDIVNISSESVIDPYPFMGSYAATKAALETISKAVAAEVRKAGIRVSIYRSGRVKGTFSRDWAPELRARAKSAAAAEGRYARGGESLDPDIPARAILDLVSMHRSAFVPMLELQPL
jgi:NAD(P)-dependent dehydrogenase (short-subunit alcohol dehydrogenase family)